MSSLAKKGLNQYLSQLQRHPLRTKAITAGMLSAISDIVAQKLSGIEKLQLRRLLLKVIFGFAYLGPFGHFLHTILDKIFKGKKDTATVAKKNLFISGGGGAVNFFSLEQLAFHDLLWGDC